MSSEENASFDNLLLLCFKHHAEVDQAGAENQFPEEKLREWKASQVELAAGNGTDISDEEAGVIRARMADKIDITADTIVMGGGGGATPLAGGGGGGVIGSGQGGPGGAAGRIVLDGRIELDGQPGQPPGAGGGGGGAVADHSILEPEVPRASIGRGGVHGMDGQPGDSSAFTTGDLTILASGGPPGLAVSTERAISPEIRVSSIMIGEHFHVRDGLVFAVAAGWSWTTCLNLPSQNTLAMLVVLEAGGTAVGYYTIRVEVRGPEGQIAGRVSFPLSVEEPGELLRVPFPLVIPVEWSSYGKWAIVVSSELGEVARTDLVVRRTAP